MKTSLGSHLFMLDFMNNHRGTILVEPIYSLTITYWPIFSQQNDVKVYSMLTGNYVA